MDNEQEASMAIVPLGTYQNEVIDIRPSDGYVNLTAMAKAVGNSKKFADWYRLDDTTEFLTALSAQMGIPISDFRKVQQPTLWDAKGV